MLSGTRWGGLLLALATQQHSLKPHEDQEPSNTALALRFLLLFPLAVHFGHVHGQLYEAVGVAPLVVVPVATSLHPRGGGRLALES